MYQYMAIFFLGLEMQLFSFGLNEFILHSYC